MALHRRDLPREQEALVSVLEERFDSLDKWASELNKREAERNGAIAELMAHSRSNVSRWQSHLEGVLSDQERLQLVEAALAEIREARKDNTLVYRTRLQLIKAQWAAIALVAAVIWHAIGGKEAVKELLKLL